MGAYTGLRGIVCLKNEFVTIVENAIKNNSWANLGYDFLDRFENYPKSFKILSSSLLDMPIYWESEKALPEWKTRVEDGMWIFQCALRNEDNTIEYFIENVLLKIAESSEHIEILYEDWDNPMMFEIFQGSVLKID